VQDSRYAVCGENYPLGDPQRELIAIAESLGPKFAERAARYDREASFPFENYDDLRASGLLGLCVPERFGGRGADFKTYSLVSATIG
jgi:alkylation response protein AidB-like acyl-CoA dehydrogenase